MAAASGESGPTAALAVLRAKDVIQLTSKENSRMDVATLADLLREAEERHGPYEATAPKHHWSAWYAAYISTRERGGTTEQASSDASLYLERRLARQASA
jgi:hypothetical protein